MLGGDSDAVEKAADCTLVRTSAIATLESRERLAVCEKCVGRGGANDARNVSGAVTVGMNAFDDVEVARAGETPPNGLIADGNSVSSTLAFADTVE